MTELLFAGLTSTLLSVTTCGACRPQRRAACRLQCLGTGVTPGVASAAPCRWCEGVQLFGGASAAQAGRLRIMVGDSGLGSVYLSTDRTRHALGWLSYARIIAIV